MANLRTDPFAEVCIGRGDFAMGVHDEHLPIFLTVKGIVLNPFSIISKHSAHTKPDKDSSSPRLGTALTDGQSSAA